MVSNSNGHAPFVRVPDRWLETPRMSKGLIEERFVAFKTPMASQYDDEIRENDRFYPSHVVNLVKSLCSSKQRLTAIISLTNTKRFYDKIEFTRLGIEYIHLPCKGRNESPCKDTCKQFIDICNRLISQNFDCVIGVHCTHGFNRTGYLIACFLTEVEECSVSASVDIFRRSRPPGIYKKDYLLALYELYDEEIFEDLSELEPTQPSSSTVDENDTKVEFTPGLIPVVNNDDRFSVLDTIRSLCSLPKERFGFIGSQPVSMTVENMVLLKQLAYKVSWKADGTRYMCLIDGPDRIFLIDRKNNVYRVERLTFFHRKEPTRHLSKTLLDGEMVVDKVTQNFHFFSQGRELSFTKILGSFFVNIVNLASFFFNSIFRSFPDSGD